MFIKKRAFVRIVSFLAAAVVALGGWGVWNFTARRRLETAALSDAHRSFTGLSEHLYKVETAFDKARYAATPYQTARLAGEIWRETGAAKSSLEQLPVYELNLGEVSEFLSKAGDYAWWLSSMIARGEGLTAGQADNMNAMADAAAGLSGHIAGLQERIYSGELTLEQVIALSCADSGGDGGDGTLVSAAQQVGEYPELIYDGPFSDHIEKQSAVFLEGRQKVSQQQARALAAGWLDLPESELSDGWETQGKVPAYVFTTDALTVAVTVYGGQLLQLACSEQVTESVISADRAVAVAAEFLRKAGIEDMKESYYMTSDGETVINFAYAKDGVTVYPDLIKVTVRLDTGRVCGYEAFGYMMAHRLDRQTAAAISEQEARAAVSRQLKIERSSLAVIPTDGKNEVLCYEFVTTASDGRHILVYVNAQTGVEEMLQILIETENGTLAS